MEKITTHAHGNRTVQMHFASFERAVISRSAIQPRTKRSLRRFAKLARPFKSAIS